MWKFIKRVFKYFGILILSVLVIGLLFLWLSPQFGGSVPEEQQAAFSKLNHYQDGIFTNAQALEFEMNCHSIEKMITDMMHTDPSVAPAQNLEVQKVQAETIDAHDGSNVQVIWFGHSTFLLKMDGQTILVDPVFSDYAAPSSLLGRKRYNEEMPISLEDLPAIDVVVISHDHYDHLDYESIVALKEKTAHFLVPLGIGSHLRAWDVSEERIVEMDWWQEEKVGNLSVACVPSRHTSGRGLTDHDATLWSGWTFKGTEQSVYYTGDGGYGKHFKQIGETFGPFDLAIVECGQYNKLWKDMHMVPEESVQAGIDAQAAAIIPGHWGAFTLAMHSWKEPVQRITAEAAKQAMPIATPQLGELFVLGQDELPTTRWWDELN